MSLPSDPCATWNECTHSPVGWHNDEGLPVSDRTQLSTPPRATIQAMAAVELGVDFGYVRVLAGWGRIFTRQEVWNEHGAERWVDLWTHNHGVGYYFAERAYYKDLEYHTWKEGGPHAALVNVPDAPDAPPPAWLPSDEWPAWSFCSKDAPGSTPIYVVETF